MTMEEILGDYQGFYAVKKAALADMGIDVEPFPMGHLAFRTETKEEYLVVRQKIEQHSIANVENVWNGRPISKLVLKQPLNLAPNVTVDLIELIPPVHQSVYKMGIEHVGFVVGDALETFAQQHKDKFTGRQFQSHVNEPYYITFPDHTNVKFHQYGLKEVCIREGRRFDDFYHIWE
jgi:predicted metalloenzyme YecM